MCVCVVYVNVAPNSFGWDEFVVVVVYECTFTSTITLFLFKFLVLLLFGICEMCFCNKIVLRYDMRRWVYTRHVNIFNGEMLGEKEVKFIVFVVGGWRKIVFSCVVSLYCLGIHVVVPKIVKMKIRSLFGKRVW